MSARPGAIGGAANEAGGEYRRGVAALFAAYGLNGTAFPGLPLSGAEAVVEAVALESDTPIDDVMVAFPAAELLIQAKRSLDFGRTMREVARQWIRAPRDPELSQPIFFVAAGGKLSGQIETLRTALERKAIGGSSLTPAESERDYV
jgi:hypothetical protein